MAAKIIHLNLIISANEVVKNIKQGVALTGRNTTGPPGAAAWWVTLRMRVLKTPTDDDRRQLPLLVWPPTLCVGGPVITFFGGWWSECIHTALIGWRVTAHVQRSTTVHLRRVSTVVRVARTPVSATNACVRPNIMEPTANNVSPSLQDCLLTRRSSDDYDKVLCIYWSDFLLICVR